LRGGVGPAIGGGTQVGGVVDGGRIATWDDACYNKAILSPALFRLTTMTISAVTQFAVCVRNDGYAASLERRKLYQVLPDALASEHGQLRVIDESGEDYLYPQDYFLLVALPEPVERAVLGAA